MARFSAFPNGWFRVAYSSELAPGDVKPLRYFGKDLVLFRDASGQAALLDAFCPHLGAHLGHGGKVAGKCVVCPFHAWHFDASGACREIPYAERIPPRARVRAWTVREHSGLVMAWYDHLGRAPSWEVPELPEYGDDAYLPYEGFRYDIRTHIQDIVENSVDNRHLTHVHGLVEANPTIVDGEGMPFQVSIDSKIQMRGNGGVMRGIIDISNYGIGISPARVKVGPIQYLFLATITPVDAHEVDARFAIALRKMADPKLTRMILDRVVEDEAEQVGRDLPIWNNKVFVDPPLLSENDSAIGPLRRWSKRFYPEFEEPGAAVHPPLG